MNKQIQDLPSFDKVEREALRQLKGIMRDNIMNSKDFIRKRYLQIYHTLRENKKKIKKIKKFLKPLKIKKKKKQKKSTNAKTSVKKIAEKFA